jgi:CheY-like chemotaxis protein
MIAQQRRYAGLVKTANAALLTIVDDILDFSKVEAGQLDLDLHAFSPSALIADTVAIIAPAADAKGLALGYTIEADVPEWVMGDDARLRQVLLNLLNNAVKFTVNGAIALAARIQIVGDGRQRLLFSVADSGIGVSPEQQHRPFKHFSQADNSVSRRHGGTGLGLAICKRLVELMDGEIGIVSKVGVGSTVWFTALTPGVSEPVAGPEVGPVHNRLTGTMPRILVVDDIGANLEIVDAYLQDNGYRVDCVTSGLKAIQALQSAPYDLVLMDIQMPGMDGVTATKPIRALAGPIGDIPILAMTGNVLPLQVQSFLDAGMNGHIGKPIDRAILYAGVQRWLPVVEGANLRIGPNAANCAWPKLEEFIGIIGRDKAEQIAERFLVGLSSAFKTTFLEAKGEAHALIGAAGALGLDAFVQACARSAERAPTHGSDHAAGVSLVREARAGTSHPPSALL